MKKTIFAITILAALLFTAACGASPAAPDHESAASAPETSYAPESEAEETSEESGTTDFVTVSPELFLLYGPEDPFDIHTPGQKSFLEGPYEAAAAYADGWHECSKPRAVTLGWKYLGELAPECGILGFTVMLGVSEDFSAPQTRFVPADGSAEFSAEFVNLYIGTRYYWKVRAEYGEKAYESGVSGFETASAAPRNLDVDGVSNVRDVGGWAIDGTHRVKQGMIYRGAAFEDAKYETHITEEGIRTARETLGVKTEIELRWITMKEIPSRSSSLLGEDIRYYEFEFSYNDEELLEGNAKSIARCFRIFADETKYPVYYHCRIGTDRTGVLTYLLLGYLGVDGETLIRDYLFSNFGYVGGSRRLSSIQKAYIDVIDSYEGETLAEKITYFLKTKCRLNDVTLEKIKAIMTEEY